MNIKKLYLQGIIFVNNKLYFLFSYNIYINHEYNIIKLLTKLALTGLYINGKSK
jgi:hypothetical protein